MNALNLHFKYTANWDNELVCSKAQSDTHTMLCEHSKGLCR